MILLGSKGLLFPKFIGAYRVHPTRTPGSILNIPLQLDDINALNKMNTVSIIAQDSNGNKVVRHLLNT